MSEHHSEHDSSSPDLSPLDSFDPQGENNLDRIDSIFQATAHSLQTMKFSAMQDLVQLEKKAAAQHKKNQEPINTSSIEDSLCQMKTWTNQYQELLGSFPELEAADDAALQNESANPCAVPPLPGDGSLSFPDLDSLLSASSALLETDLSAENSPRKAVDRPGLPASDPFGNLPSDPFSDFLKQADVWTSYLNQIQAQETMEAGNKKNEGCSDEASSSSLQKPTDIPPIIDAADSPSVSPVKSPDFFTTVQTILDEGRKKAQEIQEAFQTETRK